MSHTPTGPDREGSLLRLLEVVPSPAFLFDVDHEKFIAANELFWSLFGYSEEQFNAIRWRDFVVESEQEVLRKILTSQIVPEEPSEWHERQADQSVVRVTIRYRFLDMVRNDGSLIRAIPRYRHRPSGSPSPKGQQHLLLRVEPRPFGSHKPGGIS